VKIQLGFDLTYACADSTPMILMLNVHPSRTGDLITPDRMRLTPARSITPYIDGFGNKCVRLLAPAGELRIAGDSVVADSGRPDPVDLAAQEHAVANLPHDALVYLLASRYCETDLLMDKAWELFSLAPAGWRRVQAICDFVHAHIAFGYHHADSTRGAARAFAERRGVCRDFTHLAVTLCRCLNIPARYINGHLGDIGVPVVDPMDFSAWIEVYLAGSWWTFDPRNNMPRIGRIVVARGRDAADIPLINSFGPHVLKSFRVWTYEVFDEQASAPNVAQRGR
jgi:transglutaminase-like putative cysteine protease